MRRRSHPLKWPICAGLAVGVLLYAALIIPADWLAFLLPPAQPGADYQVAGPHNWLIIDPAPASEPWELVMENHSSKRATVVEAAPEAWSWRPQTSVDMTSQVHPFTTGEDTLSILWRELGLGAEFGKLARPDSVVAARLSLLRTLDRLRFDELKPLFLQVARRRIYADILSLAADMYAEHLEQTIQVPE